MIPEARPFLKKAESRAKSRGYVYTYLGRRRRFPDSRFAHKAGNAIIQGSSADITKLKMVEVDEYFEAETNDECGLILQIHDELDWMVAPGMEKHDEEARRIMKSFGEDDLIQMDIPIQVDGDVATDWGKASFPKFDFGEVQ
jgi:DNA polymerase I-like protein with 3'-5' exonuclease and polymerase domains